MSWPDGDKLIHIIDQGSVYAIYPIQTGVGLLRPTLNLKMCDFQTIQAVVTKFGDFSKNLTEKIFIYFLINYAY